jgi:uncharacterized membrane protein
MDAGTNDRAMAEQGTIPVLTQIARALGLLAATAYAAYFAFYTVLNHQALRTSSFDLGVENNLMWNLIHGAPLFRTTPHGGGPLGSHLGFHHTYLSFVLAPLYALSPRPDEKLILERVLRSGAFGVVEESGGFALARRGASPVSNAALLQRL